MLDYFRVFSVHFGAFLRSVGFLGVAKIYLFIIIIIFFFFFFLGGGGGCLNSRVLKTLRIFTF